MPVRSVTVWRRVTKDPENAAPGVENNRACLAGRAYRYIDEVLSFFVEVDRHFLCMYVCMYVYMCVCVCVCVDTLMKYCVSS